MFLAGHIGLWAFLERIGAGLKLPAAEVGLVFAVLKLLGGAAAFFVAWVGARGGWSLPHTVVLAGVALGLALGDRDGRQLAWLVPGLAVLLLGMLVTGAPLHPGIVLLPIIIAPLAIAVLGLSWILASLGVFLRDIQQTMGILSTVLMFLSPIFYPASALPASFQGLLALNPLTFVIEQARAVAFLDNPVNWIGWLLYLGCATLVAALGFWWFQRTRRGFADVV